MKNFTCLADAPNPIALIEQGLRFKENPFQSDSGKRKTLTMLFFNPSLRTRLSTEKAALNLHMQVMDFSPGKDGWQLEWEEGAVMNGNTQEHVQDAIGVISRYSDIIAVRTFPGLTDRNADYAESVLSKIQQHATVPVVSLESATRHPLQSLADWMTIRESGLRKPKVCVSWAPHPRALPQAVVNSFLEWSHVQEAEVVLACPEGYEPAASFLGNIPVTHRQDEALAGADFVYVKNWSSYQQYGQIVSTDPAWTITPEKMAKTNKGKFMHCLPLRRNVIATDEVVNGSIVLDQAENRVYAAQSVLYELLKNV